MLSTVKTFLHVTALLLVYSTTARALPNPLGIKTVSNPVSDSNEKSPLTSSGEAMIDSGSEEISSADLDDSDGPFAKLDNPKYFEGDLALSEEQIVQAYYKTFKPRSKVRGKRGAITYGAWPDGIVYYEFHSSVNSYLKRKILAGIADYEQVTCLQFRPCPPSGGDCVQFTAIGDGCSSSYIGRQGGIQYITLPAASYCQERGTILHEIGHAIGFWHEHSRPDRDHYVDIHWENIKDGQGHNFNIRYNADYHGVKYDYYSIMHYRDDSFSRNGQQTITPKFPDKGPLIHRTSLSENDIVQINRLYNCPQASPGYKGILKVTMGQALNLSLINGKSDPYACAEAVDNDNQRTLRCTSCRPGTLNPQWNETLDFGTSSSGWRYFEITIWDHDADSYDTSMLDTHLQTVWVEPGKHYSYFYSNPVQWVDFESNMIVDGDDCSPNPCERGICNDLMFNYSCTCPTGYSGKQCEVLLDETLVTES